MRNEFFIILSGQVIFGNREIATWVSGGAHQPFINDGFDKYELAPIRLVSTRALVPASFIFPPSSQLII
jgi:hypothetical protein